MASLSRPPHRRKHSATTNASSSSSAAATKNPYDDVLLSSGGKIKFQAHEYAEIFSGSSSIPVLDLSGLDDRPGSGDYRSSNLDYSSIFGGLRDGDAAVPYEELFNGGGVRKTETRPADPQSPFQESRSVEESVQSVDEIKQHINMSFNKISQNTGDAPNGKTHIAQLNAVPGFTRFVDGETTVPLLKREVSRTWSFSAGVKSELTSKESHTPNKKAGDVNETKHKSQVFKVPSHHPVHPSSQNEDKDPRRSRLPSFASRDSSGKTAGEHSPPLFDEELDENSIAAVSAAALKKAIEQAQESIRIAKMIMERKKDALLDGSKPRSKGRSKVKDKEETRISENVEAANAECGAGILELEKVDDKDNSICSKYKLVSDLEKEKNKPTVHWSKEPEVVAELAEIVDEISEQCEATVDPIKGSENIAERVSDCSQEQEFRSDAGENLTISHEAEITEKDNLADDEGQCEEKVVDCEDMKSENITALKVNDQHEKSGDEEENGVMQKEEHLCLKSEQDVKESAEEEILEGEPKISPEVGEVGETVNLVDESEIHEEKLNSRHEQDEIAERQMYTFQCEAAEVLKSEISEDAEEADMDEFEFQETASDKENGAVDAHSNDSSTTFSDTHINNTSSVFSETPEPCDFELNNKAQESDDRLHEETEIFSVIEDNESLHRCSSSEENLIGSKLNDGFEGLSSDSKAENVGLMDTDHEERLPNDDEMFKSANEIHNVSEVNMPNLPELHNCNDKVEEFDQTNVEQVPERTSESNEGYASTSNLEDTDEVSAHEAQTSAENANEEVKDDLDHMTSYEREYVEEQSKLTDTDKSMEKTEREEEIGESMEKNEENLSETSTAAEKDSKSNEQTFDTSDQQQRIEAIKRGREREKDRLAVERAIREARERAFTEARERAAAERAATEAKLRAERAAVERATAEARERALEKAMSQRTSTEAKTQGDKHPSDRFSSSSRNNGLKHSFSSSDLEKLDGTSSESAQRRKARLERHQRIMERSAKALAEKNMRDLLVQKEQAERNRLAESLDADIKRWATGKEGNLRALLSTLQYILGSESGWQPIPLTEIITIAAVRKAYRKATLCVHPDKLQQRRATIQQKYICEKVFDLLKAAWNRFNSEER